MSQRETIKNIVLNEILPRVQRPGQYSGGELNVIVKDPASVDLRFALAFPDTYAIGMSHLGLKILYHILNQRMDVAAERVFAPWLDMEEELKNRDVPLYTLETFSPLNEFDVIGFSIQYELCYTNVLNMLELGGVPVRTDARTMSDPVVLAGGAISSALEPLAPFLDAVIVGDAEEVLEGVTDTILEWKRNSLPRETLYKNLAALPGIYVPALYNVSYKDDGTINQIENIHPAPAKIAKASVSDLENTPYPTSPIVPNVEVIHDRINIEIMRGCPNLCRFCQAVQHYRPLKHRSIEKVLSLCENTYNNTGYEEISLTSLSTADYPGIEDLLAELIARFSARKVNVSLPSLRVGEQLRALPKLAGSVRKAGLTMAPEVATDRLREIIKKPIRTSDFLAGCEAAYRAGYRLLKLYFLIGCPTETDEDLEEISNLINEASLLRKSVCGKKAHINASISSHIPKPHTPFQWAEMNTREDIRSKQAYVLSRKKSSLHRYKFHDVNMSFIEAVFSRGDRRLASALLKARERGLRMDAWNEAFAIHRWEEVFQQSGIDPDFFAYRARNADEILPWSMIQLDTPVSFLRKEAQRAGILG
jgi:radical SAM family uncharacterized protein